MKDSTSLRNYVRQAVTVTLALLLLCGFLFPVVLSGISAVVFPRQAKGSLIEINGQTVGAEHVGQEFTEDYFLWSCPSPYHYNVYVEDEEGNQYYKDGSEFAGLSSGSNNYAPSNPALTERVEADLASFLEKNPAVAAQEVPTDLLTASGSGLDPHISVASAEIQIPRIAADSGLTEEMIRQLIQENTEGKLLGIFGGEGVNVLKVNIGIAEAMGLLEGSEAK